MLTVILLALPMTVLAEEVRLRDAFDVIQTMYECRNHVGPGLAPSFPLPTLVGKKLRYRQMFYTSHTTKLRSDPDKQVMPPRVFAEFNLDGTELMCGISLPMPPSEFGKPLGRLFTPETRGMEHDAWEDETGKLFDLTQELGDAFAAGRSDAATSAKARRFRTSFARLSSPGLKAHYRALCPDFWKWLEALDKK